MEGTQWTRGSWLGALQWARVMGKPAIGGAGRRQGCRLHVPTRVWGPRELRLWPRREPSCLEVPGAPDLLLSDYMEVVLGPGGVWDSVPLSDGGGQGPLWKGTLEEDWVSRAVGPLGSKVA